MKRAAKSDLCSAAARIAEILRTPGTVALLPTETVYGLVCRAQDEDAISKIRKLKHRDPAKFFGWFIPDWKEVEKFGLTVNPDAEKLFEKYFPGAVTLILNKTDGTTQAVRTPDHPLITELLKHFDEPLVQTSANGSGMADALSLEQALAQLDGEPDITFDGGNLEPGAMGSTIVDTTKNPPLILRQGHTIVSFE